MDSICWSPSKSRVFSLGRAYSFILSRSDPDVVTPFGVGTSFWMTWKVHLPPKFSPLGPSCFVEVTRERQVLVLLSVIIMVGG
ncbi:hypothetical protein ES332_A05G145900v1 [Gossypium tomentosum]|uniref:Uncharacterized protein n=1 Tax=Gossypium tomentosum TaxID=34277 RepID=A0A5D2QF39_GOSTO|nr:hypothetical protein ES332_A05G145900v1 [Gossypium tomentosum]